MVEHGHVVARCWQVLTSWSKGLFATSTKMNSPETVPTVPLLRQIKSKALEVSGPSHPLADFSHFVNVDFLPDPWSGLHRPELVGRVVTRSTR